MQYGEFDDQNHPRHSTSDFARLIDAALDRRAFMRASLGTAAFILTTGCDSQSAQNTSSISTPTEPLLGFDAVASSTADTVTLPPGYTWSPLISWGDPISASANPFSHPDALTAAEQALAFGDNNDGMTLFEVDADHAVLAVNNEYINRWNFYSDTANPTADEVSKAQLAHGVTLLNLHRENGAWRVQLDGPNTRRVTAQSPVQFSGPASGHSLLQTTVDPSGTAGTGTFANCGTGRTPWGTLLTCEENFNAYFSHSAAAYTPTPAQQRYGLGESDWGLHWGRFDARFDTASEPNEPHRFGWVVEIDPMDPTNTPRKRTALGRFKHENAEVVLAKDGRVVVYMGDDERGEYLYRFVSSASFRPGDAAHNSTLLDEGTLYAARFEAPDDALSGSGQWLALKLGENGIGPDSGFNDQAEICVLTRLAATAAAATTLDRPEWVSAHPTKAEVYCALTNNTARGVGSNAGGVSMPVGGPNPRAENLYGQIVRWRPTGGDHTSDTFDWDLFAVAGNPLVHNDGLNAGSSNITPGNLFNAPDGLAFDKRGALWIQTDGNFSNAGEFAGMGNNQMLAANPETGEIRRFLVGPLGCEVTGMQWSEDNTALFVGIQHPGDHSSGSHFPDGDDAIPRATVIVVTRQDGGVIGA